MNTNPEPVRSPSRGKKRPVVDDLRKSLGPAHVPLDRILAWLASSHPAVTFDERFHAEAGWHRIYFLKKRRLFYLTPKHRDFRFALILGDRSVAALGHGEFAARLRAARRSSRRHAEGTAFIFDAASFEPELVIAMIEAKIGTRA